VQNIRNDIRDFPQIVYYIMRNLHLKYS